MHKWKLFKKSAALVLSSAVIASGVPVTAMASEAEVFSDVSEEKQEESISEDQETVSQEQVEVIEEDSQPEEAEESDAEAIQEEVAEISAEEIQQEEEPQIQEDTEEAFGDGEAFMAEAGEVLQDASEITVAGVKYMKKAKILSGALLLCFSSPLISQAATLDVRGGYHCRARRRDCAASQSRPVGVDPKAYSPARSDGAY